jgi:hypothetical protein
MAGRCSGRDLSLLEHVSPIEWDCRALWLIHPGSEARPPAPPGHEGKRLECKIKRICLVPFQRRRSMPKPAYAPSATMTSEPWAPCASSLLCRSSGDVEEKVKCDVDPGDPNSTNTLAHLNDGCEATRRVCEEQKNG